jgi:hypothetical protein
VRARRERREGAVVAGAPQHAVRVTSAGDEDSPAIVELSTRAQVSPSMGADDGAAFSDGGDTRGPYPAQDRVRVCAEGHSAVSRRRRQRDRAMRLPGGPWHGCERGTPAHGVSSVLKRAARSKRRPDGYSPRASTSHSATRCASPTISLEKPASSRIRMAFRVGHAGHTRLEACGRRPALAPRRSVNCFDSKVSASKLPSSRSCEAAIVSAPRRTNASR